MTFAQQVFAALSTDPALARLVGDRIYPNLLPQECLQPAIVFYVLNDTPENTLTTKVADTAKNAQLQVDVTSPDYDQAATVALVTAGVLGDLANPSPGLSANLESSRELYDNATQLHRVSMDFNVWR